MGNTWAQLDGDPYRVRVREKPLKYRRRPLSTPLLHSGSTRRADPQFPSTKMANSYQQSWQRPSVPYGTNLVLEQDYTFHDNTYGYTQSKSSNTPNVAQPSDTTYPQSSPSYGTTTTTGSYTFGTYVPSTQDEESYDGFPSQSLSDHGYNDSLMNETTQMSNVHYLRPTTVPQPDPKQPYVYTDMTQGFQFHPPNGADMNLGYKRPRYSHSAETLDEHDAEHQENKEGLKPRWVFFRYTLLLFSLHTGQVHAVDAKL